MKCQNRVLMGLFFLLVIFSLNGESHLIPLNSGKSIDSGEALNPLVMENQKGELYLLYIKEGNLLARKSADKGETFHSFDLSGLKLDHVRELTLYHRFYKEWLAVFIGESDNTEGLYALGFNEKGEPDLLFKMDDSSPGAIGTFMLERAGFDNFFVLYTKGAGLKWTYINEENSLIQGNLSSSDEKLENFDAYMSYETSPALFMGYYSAGTAPGKNNIVYYELSKGVLKEKLTLLENTPAENFRIDMDRGSGGNPFITVISRDEAHLFMKGEEQWPDPYSVTLPFKPIEIESIFQEGRFFHMALDSNNICYGDFDGTPVFENPVKISERALVEMPRFISLNNGEAGGTVFLYKEPALELAVVRNNADGSLLPVPQVFPGKLVDVVLQEENNSCLALFEVEGRQGLFSGKINETDGMWDFTEIPSKEAVVLSRSLKEILENGKESSLVFGSHLGLFNGDFENMILIESAEIVEAGSFKEDGRYILLKTGPENRIFKVDGEEK